VVATARHRRIGTTREAGTRRPESVHSLCRTIVAQVGAYHFRVIGDERHNARVRILPGRLRTLDASPGADAGFDD
jgi:hypothetical protein